MHTTKRTAVAKETNMKSIVRIIVITLLLGGLAGALVWGFYARHGEQQADAQQEAPIKAPSRVASEGGQIVLSFDEDAQKANGIQVRALAVTRQRSQTQATGVVVQLQPLLDLKAGYNTPRTDLLRTRANARASEQEYLRLKDLNQNGENASDKAVEAARAAAEGDAALVENAQQAITILNGSALLHWGPVVAGWMERNSPEFNALLAQKLFLLQVTSTTSGAVVSPREATVQLADGTRTQATFVSVIPQLDPRLQTPSLLYVIRAHPGLVPGINLSVFLPTGSLQSGVTIPATAVVWSQGNAWCYVESSSGKFVRTLVDTSVPVAGGWFVSKSLEPGVHVVTSGAQTLLSEEFRSQIQADTD